MIILSDTNEEHESPINKEKSFPPPNEFMFGLEEKMDEDITWKRKWTTTFNDT